MGADAIPYSPYTDGSPSAPPPYYSAPVTVQPVAMLSSTTTAPPVGPNSASVICHGCQTRVNTIVRHNSNSRTHCWACICFFSICFCPIFWLPYCCNSCQDANHYCPNCRTFIGTYKQQ